MADVAFIGLGAMGQAMAHTILQGGFSVVGFDTADAALERHVANGGISAATAREAAGTARVVITMLPKGNVVRSAVFDEGGIAEALGKGGILVDMSTVHPLESDAIRADLQTRGIDMVDAPVGRTSKEAETGTLLIMAGGEPGHIERIRPYFECMGDTIVDCGGPGRGIRMKIVNNLMTTSLNVLTAEVLTFSDALGLDRDLALEVMKGTAAGRGHMSTTYPAKVLKGDLTPAFMIDLASKDLNIALDLSTRIKVPLTLAEAASAVYASARENGRGAEDWTAIYAMLRSKYAALC